MNLRLNYDELYGKRSDILKHIQEKLNITVGDFTFVRKGEEHFKATLSNETCFKESIKANLILKESKVILKEGKAIFTPNEGIMYTCRALLQIQSIFFNMKDNKDETGYYPQLLLEQCVCKRFFNNTIFHPDLEFTDTESDSDSESEEEINENTAFDE